MNKKALKIIGIWLSGFVAVVIIPWFFILAFSIDSYIGTMLLGWVVGLCVAILCNHFSDKVMVA